MNGGILVSFIRLVVLETLQNFKNRAFFAGIISERPDQRDNPANTRKAEQQIHQQNRHEIVVLADQRNPRWQKHQRQTQDQPRRYADRRCHRFIGHFLGSFYNLTLPSCARAVKINCALKSWLRMI